MRWIQHLQQVVQEAAAAAKAAAKAAASSPRAEPTSHVPVYSSGSMSGHAGEAPSPSLRLASWDDVVVHRGTAPFGGLRDALIEHELCVTAPNGFAGSQFSTWSNLIGARRWLAGRGAACPQCR